MCRPAYPWLTLVVSKVSAAAGLRLFLVPPLVRQNPNTEDWLHIEALKKQASGDGATLFAETEAAKRPSKSRSSGFLLYDRIYQSDTLEAACSRVHANPGSPGVDGVTIQQIEASEAGVKGFVDEFQESLRARVYRPKAVRRVYHTESEWDRSRAGAEMSILWTVAEILRQHVAWKVEGIDRMYWNVSAQMQPRKE